MDQATFQHLNLFKETSKTNWLTDSMRQNSSSEINIFSADKLPCLWNLNIYHCIHTSQAIDHFPNHMNPVYNLPCYFRKIPF
jgi:hypothetical protein